MKGLFEPERNLQIYQFGKKFTNSALATIRTCRRKTVHFNCTLACRLRSLEHPSFMPLQHKQGKHGAETREKETRSLNRKRLRRRPASGPDVPRRTRWAAHGIRPENRPTLLRRQPQQSPQRPNRKSHHRTTTPTKPHKDELRSRSSFLEP